MKKVAIFGNTGGGKSTLARRLSELTKLPLYPLDRIQYRAGGGKVPHDEYLKAHAEVIGREAWIIDGYGCTASSWERFAIADTLIHVDLPLAVHYLWVTKRFIKGIVVNPEGWPVGSPMLRSTIDSYRVVRLCHLHLTPKYRQLMTESAGTKRIHHLRSPREIREFLEIVAAEFESAQK